MTVRVQARRGREKEVPACKQPPKSENKQLGHREATRYNCAKMPGVKWARSAVLFVGVSGVSEAATHGTFAIEPMFGMVFVLLKHGSFVACAAVSACQTRSFDNQVPASPSSNNNC